MKLKLACFLLLLIVISPIYSQKENYNWYFGYGAGLTFLPDGTKPTVLTDGKLNNFEGSSSGSDKDGKLLFYSDGITVWNRKHEPMPNGRDLYGNMSATQSTLIVPKPGDDKIYYIFTNDATEQKSIKGLCYSIIDMSLNGGLGDVTSKNIQLFTPSSEKLAGVVIQDSTGYWILAHKFKGNEFMAFKVTRKGVDPSPVISRVGTPYDSIQPSQVGQLKFSVDGSKVAVALYGLSVVETFDFDKSTGKLSNHRIICDQRAMPVRPYDQAYGMEFSYDGSKLYCCMLIPPAILQFSRDKKTNDYTLSAVIDTVKTMGQMQLGPDKKIYMATWDSKYISVINKPDLDYPACDLEQESIYLEGKASSVGLPNFVPRLTPCFIGVHLDKDSIALCEGDTAKITAYADYPGDNTFLWSTGDTTAEIYASKSGIYTVIISNGSVCHDSAHVIVRVSPRPVAGIEIKGDTTMCKGDSVLLVARPNDREKYSYKWSDGSDKPSITVKKAGIYTLTITNEFGCSDEAEVDINFLSDLDAKIEASGSTKICKGGKIELMAKPLGDDYTYLWSTGETTPSLMASDSGVYKVLITSKFGCKDSAEISVTVYPSVEAGIEAEGATTLCRGDSVRLIATPKDNNCFFQWSDGRTSPSIFVSEPGTYKVTITNQYGCIDSAEITININPPVKAGIEAAGSTSFCKGDSARLSATPDDKNCSYLWSTGETARSITVRDQGLYKVTVTNQYGCKDSAEIQININPSVTATIESSGGTNICKGDRVILTARPENKDYTYYWSTGQASPEITVSDPGTYKVIITNEYGCSDSAFISIKLNPEVSAGIKTGDGKKSICPGESLELFAEPNDNNSYSYAWSNGQSGKSIVISDSGYYSVTVTNSTGCKDTAGIFIALKASVELSVDTTFSFIGNGNTIITLRLKLLGGTVPSPARISTEIILDASSFVPDAGQALIKQTSINNDGFYHITVENDNIEFVNNEAEAIQIKGMALLGRSLRNVIKVTSPEISGSDVCADTARGLLILENVCSFSKRRLQALLAPAALEIAPNPSGGETEIKASYQEAGAYQLEIYTVEGKSSFSNQWINETDKTQERRFNIDLSAYPAGIYYAVLRSPSGTVARKMAVVR